MRERTQEQRGGVEWGIWEMRIGMARERDLEGRGRERDEIVRILWDGEREGKEGERSWVREDEEEEEDFLRVEREILSDCF